MPRLEIVIVARIPLIREGLRALLGSEPNFHVTALAPSDDLLEDLHTAAAHILLLDVEVLEREGWELLDDLRRALSGMTTLILSDNDQDPRVTSALELGARGYLLRDSNVQEMADAIRAAQSGTVVLHPQIAAALLDSLRQARATARAADDESEANENDLIEPLSARELDVLRLMTRGMSNKQIAAELYITEHTVKFHIRAILGKLGAANRTEAVTLSLQKGLVSL